MAVYIPLPGSRRVPLPQSRPAGQIDRSQIESITVRVRGAEETHELEREIYEQAQKPLKDRRYLSHTELEEKYGASEADLDRVEQYAQAHDLKVVHRSAAERSIVLRGALGNLLSAFPAQLNLYHHSLRKLPRPER